MNPADIATRLLSPVVFVERDMWWKGPDFLHYEDIQTPCQSFLRPEIVPEVKCVQVALVVEKQNIFGVGEVLDCSRFGSLTKLLRVTSFVKVLLTI